MRARVALGALLLAGCAAAGEERLRPVLAEDFAAPAALERFAFSDPAAWRWSAEEGASPALELADQSDYAPPHRSPLNIALVRELVVGDFTLEVEALQTGREYGHRDLCLFFGWQSPARFYYAHLATTPDERAHNVFLVDGADRRPLAPVAQHGVDWGSGEWHHLRLERELATGAVRVYFDGVLALSATDGTLGPGRVGLGSFDDTGRFRALRVSSPDARAEAPPAPLFE